MHLTTYENQRSVCATDGLEFPESDSDLGLDRSSLKLGKDHLPNI